MLAREAVVVRFVEQRQQGLAGVDDLRRNLVHEIDRAPTTLERRFEDGSRLLGELLEARGQLLDQIEQAYRDRSGGIVRLPDQLELAHQRVVVRVRRALDLERRPIIRTSISGVAVTARWLRRAELEPHRFAP